MVTDMTYFIEVSRGFGFSKVNLNWEGSWLFKWMQVAGSGDGAFERFLHYSPVLGLDCLLGPCVFVVVLLLFLSFEFFHSFCLQFLIYSTHVDGVAKFLRLHAFLLVLSVVIDLVLQLWVKMILHLAFPVQHRLGHSPILLWSEVCFTRSFDFIPVIVFTHFVHLHLL